MGSKLIVACFLLFTVLFVSSISTTDTKYNRAFHYAYRTPIGEESENYLTEEQHTYEDEYNNEEEQDEYVQDYDSEYMEFENGEEEEPAEEAETLAANVITPTPSTPLPLRPVTSNAPVQPPTPQPPVAKSVAPVQPPTVPQTNNATAPPAAAPIVPPTAAPASQPTHNAEATGPTLCLPTQTLTQTTGPNGTVTRSCVDVPPVVSLTCKSYGDPHVTSFSGVQFDFYDEGQYTYVRSAGNDFAVFGRLRSWGDGSVTTAVTVQVNSKDTFTFDAETHTLYYKTTPLPFNTSETSTIALHAVTDDSVIYYKPNRRVIFDIKSGAKVFLTFYTNQANTTLPNSRPSFINLEIVVPTTMKLKDGFCLSTDNVLKTIPSAEQFKDAAFPRNVVESTKPNKTQPKWASGDAKKRAQTACAALFKDGSRAFKACVRDFKRSRSEAEGHFMAESTKDFIERKNRFEKRIANNARYEDKLAKIYNTEKLIDIQKADKEYEELKQQVNTGNITAPH